MEMTAARSFGEWLRGDVMAKNSIEWIDKILRVLEAKIRDAKTDETGGFVDAAVVMIDLLKAYEEDLEGSVSLSRSAVFTVGPVESTQHFVKTE